MIMDLFLLAVCIFLLIEMSQALSSAFEPLWDTLEEPDASVPSPSAAFVPGYEIEEERACVTLPS